MHHRIYFKDNPFPTGHALKTFRWSGRLDPDRGLFFDFYLETEDYNAEDERSDASDDLPDWQSRAVWNNYHSCTIASKEKQQDGILVAVPGQTFDFKHWDTKVFTADTFPLEEEWDPDDLAFGIYLLGHDSCAGHCISISPQAGGLFNIHWTGRIALTYAGEERFDYEFEALIAGTGFDGIYYPQSYTQEEARQLLQSMVADAGRFVFEDLNPRSFKREYKFVLEA